MNVLSRVLCAATGIHIAHFVAFAAFGYMKIRTLEWKAVRANADILLNERFSARHLRLFCTLKHLSGQRSHARFF